MPTVAGKRWVCTEGEGVLCKSMNAWPEWVAELRAESESRRTGHVVTGHDGVRSREQRYPSISVDGKAGTMEGCDIR